MFSVENRRKLRRILLCYSHLDMFDFAQPGNETRTTDSSLKCLAAALLFRPMMFNFGAMSSWLSKRRNG